MVKRARKHAPEHADCGQHLRYFGAGQGEGGVVSSALTDLPDLHKEVDGGQQVSVDVHRLVVQLKQALGAHADIHFWVVAIPEPVVGHSCKPVRHVLGVRKVVHLHQLTVAVNCFGP